MEEAPILTFQGSPIEAIQEWHSAAGYAADLRIEFDAARAHACLTPPAAEGQKVTDGQRDAYATTQTAELARKAALAANTERAARVWMDYVIAMHTPSPRLLK